MRLFFVLVLSLGLACKSSGDSSEMAGGAMASAADAGRDSIETALKNLGIDGRIIRIDLNEGRDGERLRIAQTHLMSELLLLETSADMPKLFALDRVGLDPRWVSPLQEPSKFGAAENGELCVLVSDHFAHVLESSTGRRALQFVRGQLAGLRQPFLKLPVSPTGGAAVGNDTFYLPSLGGVGHNKTIESVSAVTGAFGWGYRTSGDILTTPAVGGSAGDPKLYFVTNTGLITCIDAANYGHKPRGPRWEKLLEHRCDFDLFVTSDTKDLAGAVFAADRSGVVYSLNRITGDRNWTHASEREPTGGPMVFDGSLLVIKTKSGLMAFDATNVMYRVTASSGPDAGKVYYVRGTDPVTAGGMTLQIQGEVLTASVTEEDATLSVNGGEGTNRASLFGGARVTAGGASYDVEDMGGAPLWTDLEYDRVVGKIGDTILAVTGNTVYKLNAWTGEQMGEGVQLPGARLMPANTTDSNLFVVGGDAVVYALFPR